MCPDLDGFCATQMHTLRLSLAGIQVAHSVDLAALALASFTSKAMSNVDSGDVRYTHIVTAMHSCLPCEPSSLSTSIIGSGIGSRLSLGTISCSQGNMPSALIARSKATLSGDLKVGRHGIEASVCGKVIRFPDQNCSFISGIASER